MQRSDVQLRRIPYPYRAMLAICSDLDETPDRQTYWEIMRFLNTTEDTAMGPGVGLEVGNSIYFDMPPGQFSYWNTDDAGREMIRSLIHSGHIDCLHSYGDLATTRAHAGRALDELARHGCKLEVWVDHAVAPTNFGADIMHGHGDEPGHEAYHADLTTGHGVRYVWRGRVTSVLGQDIRPRLGGILSARHPLASSRTLAKETTKRILARRGNGKYAMHRPNRIIRQVSLRDGQAVYEFMRSNPHWGGVSCCETARGIGKVLTESMLNRLAQREGICILYTHLGKVINPVTPFAPAACKAFRQLADRRNRGEILVTTTHKLLRYITVRNSVRFRAENADGRLRITIDHVADPVHGTYAPSPDELQGLTFSAPRCEQVELADATGNSMPCEVSHLAEATYVTIPWHALEFPSQ